MADTDMTGSTPIAGEPIEAVPADDVEVPAADAWEQVQAAAAPDRPAATLPDDVEVPLADAWEQRQSAGELDDDDRSRG